MRLFLLGATVGLFGLAIVGFSLSLLTHFYTFLGVNLTQEIPQLWLLHQGNLLVMLPVVLILKQIQKENKTDAWWMIKRIIHLAPVWLLILLFIIFFYTGFNFFFTTFYLNSGGVPTQMNGMFALLNHGQVVRELTPEAFQLHQAYRVRGFSGQWLWFYSFAMMIFYVQFRRLRFNEPASPKNCRQED
jgi:hypothetical protein